MGSGDVGAESGDVEAVVASWIGRRLEGRAEGLDELIAAHPELGPALRRRVAELDRLGMLDSAGAGVPGALGASAPRLEGYEVLRPLGRGGMGVVWEARDLALDRKVAIKVMAPFHTEETRERFQREIATLARLRHPHIVVVYGTGTTRDGAPYISMERVDGEPLTARLPEPGRKPAREEVAQLVRIAARVARALEAAHEAGVVHRDVKPGNVLIDREGSPVLLDFGLALAEGGESLTRSGEFLGTLAYTAPEQALGQRVDRRADVFGLGATLYHLVTGAPPFPARTLSDLVRRLQAGPPTSASRANRSLKSDLAVVLDHAVAPDPRDRYASCADLADDLEAVLEGRPIRARRLPRSLRALRWVGRHKAVTGLALASAVVLSLSTSIWRREVVAAEHTRFLTAFRTAQALLIGHVGTESVTGGADATLDRVVGLLQECTRLRPERPEPFLRLAEAHLRAQDPAKARIALDEGLRRGGSGFYARALDRRISDSKSVTFEEVPREEWVTWSQLDRFALAEAARGKRRIGMALEILLDPSFDQAELILPALLVGVCAQEDFARATRKEHQDYFANPDLALRTAIGAYELASQETTDNQTARDNLFNVLNDRLRWIEGLPADEVDEMLERVEAMARAPRLDGDEKLHHRWLAHALFRRVEKQRASPEHLAELRGLLSSLGSDEVLGLPPNDYISWVEMVALVLDPEAALDLLRQRDFGAVASDSAGPFHLLARIVEPRVKAGWYEPDIERLVALGDAHADELEEADLDAGLALLETIEDLLEQPANEHKGE